MRLWHQDLLHFLDDRRLLGQWRELCALRGRGWGRKHATIDYVFRHSYSLLFDFQRVVFGKMTERGFKPDPVWVGLKAVSTGDGYHSSYQVWRGSGLAYADVEDLPNFGFERGLLEAIVEPGPHPPTTGKTVYPEHDGRYLLECLNLLERKGADLVNGESVAGWKLRLAAGGVT